MVVEGSTAALLAPAETIFSWTVDVHFPGSLLSEISVHLSPGTSDSPGTSERFSPGSGLQGAAWLWAGVGGEGVAN